MASDDGKETWWAQERNSDGSHTRFSGRELFDELVIHGLLHLEWMEGNHWWMRVGDVRMVIELEADGRVRVDVERGSYEPVHGTTSGQEPER